MIMESRPPRRRSRFSREGRKPRSRLERARRQVLPAGHEDDVQVLGGEGVQNELEALVFVDMAYSALTDVEFMRTSERSMGLTLWLPATATVCRLSSE